MQVQNHYDCDPREIKNFSNQTLHFISGDREAENEIDRFGRLIYRGEGNDFWVSSPFVTLDVDKISGSPRVKPNALPDKKIPEPNSEAPSES